MRFGMILLVVILAISFVGSIIPQGNEAMWYVQNYPTTHRWIFQFGADHLFTTWYFVGLVALLCGNLLLCSVVRVGRLRGAAKRQAEAAAAVQEMAPLSPEQRSALEAHLKAARYRPNQAEGCTVWTKNALGFYGSFLTRLGILLVFVMGGVVLACSDVRDYTAYPGQDTILADGPAELSVNHPHSFRGHKFYQQAYGTCGSITVVDGAGGTDTFTVDEVCFLSEDGVSGI